VIKVLSIDGGGIRGIIPAMLLEHIEARTGKRIAELFDLIAGTSTGGILALGLTTPDAHGHPKYTAAQLRALYETRGEDIFSRSVWHMMRAVGSALEEKYPSDGVEGVLKEYFGDTRLKDAITPVLVPSYEIELRDPFFFKSAKAKTNAEYDFPMWAVARATSAAPTYFEPAKLPVQGPLDYYALIDGGVYANNPAMCAYVEAVRTVGDNKAEVLVVSLGTGQLTRQILYDQAKSWGLLQWAQPILNVVFDGVSDTVDYQLATLLSDTDPGRRYYRFQTALKEGSDDMDDASRTNLRVLKLLAAAVIDKEHAAIDSLCAQL
jgi:patatin-like phospholipase/acyl hydrolase